MARTKCTHCGARFKINDEALGRTAKCPKCGEQFRVEPLTETAIAQPPNTTQHGRRPLALILSAVAVVAFVAGALAVVASLSLFGDSNSSSGIDLDADRSKRQARLEAEREAREIGQAGGEQFRTSIEDTVKAEYQASVLGSWERLTPAPKNSGLKYPTMIEFYKDGMLLTDMDGDGTLVESTYDVNHLSGIECQIENRPRHIEVQRLTVIRINQVPYARRTRAGYMGPVHLLLRSIDAARRLSSAPEMPEMPEGWNRPLTESEEMILGTWELDKRNGQRIRFLENAKLVIDPDTLSAVTGFYTFKDGRLRTEVRQQPNLSMNAGYMVDDDILTLVRQGTVTYYLRATESAEDTAAQQKRLRNRPVDEKPIATAGNYGLGLSIISPRELEVQGLTVDAPLVAMNTGRLKYYNLLFLVEPGTSIGYFDPISMRSNPLILASLRRVTWNKRSRSAAVHPDGEINRIGVRPGVRPDERQVYCEMVAYRPTYGSSFITRLGTATGLSIRDTEIDPHVAAILASEPLDQFHPHVQIAIWLAARQNIKLENVNESYADNPFSEEDWNRAVALEERTRP